MDHLLKEELELIKEQNEEIIDDLALLKEKLGIVDEDNESEEEDKEEKDLDF